MNIGKKIKSIRIEKLMTQSELAGETITRNMLSQIENGVAQPSLATIGYLANRLGVPAGYLLSEGEEEFVYNKTRVMRNIKKAYLGKNYQWCREMCVSSFDEFDDELELILTDCCVGEGQELVRNGKLHQACDMLDEALRHSEKTIYPTVTQRNSVFVMFYLLRSISPALDSNEADTDIALKLLKPELFDDVFCKYISVFFNPNSMLNESIVIESRDMGSEYDALFSVHLKARRDMMNGNYKEASSTLKLIMDGQTVPEKLLLYFCCGDMEKCCKEMGDYKGAYEFSNNKMDILEHMLAEL